jgi:cytochrome c oxidase assembly protein subunit 15
VPPISARAYQRITLLALVALGFIIVTGGAVRLTGSGLGCPKWPQCAGSHVVPAAHFRPWIEFGNRIVTAIVSIAVIVAAVGARYRIPRRRDLMWLAGALVVGVLAQIVLGGETVRHKLNPAFVMSHFLLSMLIVWAAVVLHHRAGLPDDRPHAPLVDRDLVWVGRLMAFMAAMTVVIGTIVTGAGPHSGATSGDKVAARWQINLHRITQFHGTSAMLLLALTVITVWLLRSQGGPALAQERSRQVLEALAFQITIGYSQYFTHVPAYLVAIHILGAVVVWATVLRFALALGSGGVPTRPAVPLEPATIG